MIVRRSTAAPRRHRSLRALTVLTCVLVLGARRAAADDQVSATIHAIVDAAVHPDLRWPRFPDHQSDVLRLYAGVDFHPIWLHDRRPTPAADAVLASLLTADERGLSASDYDADLLRADATRLGAEEGTSEALGRFDTALTVCVMRFLSDAYIGRVNPHAVGFGLDVEPKKLDLVLEVTALAKGETPIAARLAALDPPFPVFARLKAALADLRARDVGDEPQVAALPKLRPGDHDPGVPALRRRLAFLGDLSNALPPPKDHARYDPLLAGAVKRFQERHGRDPDGVIGALTLADLQVPIRDRIQQVALAMERLRWLPANLTGRFVIVNIPEFRLRGIDSTTGETLVSMRVVVGSAVKQTLTPTMEGEMEYLVFRPYWDVPPTIARTEILPKLATDPQYLARENMELIGSTVRQRPGPTNSLGLLKFVFPNVFSVYLHDTPSKRLFAKSRRDFSHGCIRVADPVALAEFLLGPESAWSATRIADAMEHGPNDRRLNLPVPVPVYIFYTTVVAEEDGRLFFYEDIYGHDATLARELAKGYPYPA
jgi:L,D-transpeptidase YcbB